MDTTTSQLAGSKPLNRARVPLYFGGISAILASICCLGPFLFITIGLSSAWILYLITLAEWSRLFFIVVALASLFFAYKRIWWEPVTACRPGEDCSNQQANMTYKGYFLVVVALVIAMFMLPHVAPSMD